MSPADCLAATGLTGVTTELIAGLVLVAGGIGLFLLLRRRGRKAAGSAMLALILVAGLLGVIAPHDAANAAVTCNPSPSGAASPQSSSTPQPTVTQTSTPTSTPSPTPTPTPTPIPSASLGDSVWLDEPTADGGTPNGIHDAGEPPVPGAIVTLLDAATGNPVTTGAGGVAISSTQTTDASGHYTFANLAPGSYRVRIDLPSIPSEFVYVSINNNGFDGTFVMETLDSAGTVVKSLPAPSTGCIANNVAILLGTGHTVRMLLNGVPATKADVPSTLVVSSSVGSLSSLVPPAAPTLTTPNASGNPAVDSSFDPATSETTSTITLAAGDALTDVNAGITLPRSGGGGGCD